MPFDGDYTQEKYATQMLDAYKKVTLDQILNHRGGLPHDLQFTQEQLDKIVGKSTDPTAVRFTMEFVGLSNHRPAIPEQSEAIWRRVRLVPWPVTIPRNERDLGLQGKLMSELPGPASAPQVGQLN